MTAYYLSEIVKLIEELNTYHCGSSQAFRFELGELYFKVKFMQEDPRADFQPTQLGFSILDSKLFKCDAQKMTKVLQQIIDSEVLHD